MMRKNRQEYGKFTVIGGNLDNLRFSTNLDFLDAMTLPLLT